MKYLKHPIKKAITLLFLLGATSCLKAASNELDKVAITALQQRLSILEETNAKLTATQIENQVATIELKSRLAGVEKQVFNLMSTLAKAADIVIKMDSAGEKK